MSNNIRLQKYLAQCGICSRRKAEQFIAEGRVSVDGQKISQMGFQIIVGESRVTFDNKPVEMESELVYFLLNKPKGYVTTLSDPQGRPIVTSLLKDVKFRLYPVGRLDLDTEGALILTNDGALAQKIQHPSNVTYKSYEAVVQGLPSKRTIAQLTKGILLEGKMTSPAKVSIINKLSRSSVMKIIIHEGRKRQVRKMFSLVGHPVSQLKRTAYGKLPLGQLGIGEYRRLNSLDLKKIFL